MAEILLIVVLALLLASLLVGPIGWRHDRVDGFLGAWIFALLVLLPLLWLTVLWVPPAGPAAFGLYWAAPLVVGLLVLLLLVATSPLPRRGRGGEVRPEPTDGEVAAAGITAVFLDVILWLFLILAIAFILIGIFA
jgi:hypothetical protein